MNRETHYAAANKRREGGGSRIQSVLSKLSTPASCFMLITMVLHGGAYNAASMWGEVEGRVGGANSYLPNEPVEVEPQSVASWGSRSGSRSGGGSTS